MCREPCGEFKWPLCISSWEGVSTQVTFQLNDKKEPASCGKNIQGRKDSAKIVEAHQGGVDPEKEKARWEHQPGTLVQHPALAQLP